MYLWDAPFPDVSFNSICPVPETRSLPLVDRHHRLAVFSNSKMSSVA